MGGMHPVERPKERLVQTIFPPSKRYAELTDEEKNNWVIRGNALDAEFREREIFMSEIRLLQDHIVACARKEGLVNSPVNCRHLALRYLHLLDKYHSSYGLNEMTPLPMTPLPPLDDYKITHEMQSNHPVWKDLKQKENKDKQE